MQQQDDTWARGRIAQNILLHPDTPTESTNSSHGQQATTAVDNVQAYCHRSILQHITHGDSLQNRPNWQDENISKVVRISMFVDGLPSETNLDKRKTLHNLASCPCLPRTRHSMNGQGIQSMQVPLNISVIVHTKYRLYRRMAMRMRS